jgi:ABC-type sugar transport system substrate-binding protein
LLIECNRLECALGLSVDIAVTAGQPVITGCWSQINTLEVVVMRKRVLVVAVMGLLVAALSFGAGTGEDASADDGVTIGLSYDSLESAWLVMNHATVVEEIEARGGTPVSVMAEGDAARQNQQIENLLARGVDAILCFPKDSAAIVTSIRKCREAGVPIVMINRSVSGGVLPDVQVIANNQAMAEKVLSEFGEIARRDGQTYNTILLIGNLSDENAGFRKAGHDAAIANYPDVFNVVAGIPTEWNLDIALKGLQNALQANPDANLIVTPSDYLWPPIRSSLEQIGRWAPIGDADHFPVVSFDGDEVGMQYLKDGYNWGDAAQDAFLEAELAVEWAYRLIDGETPPANIIYDEGQIVTLENFDEIAPTVWSWSLLK